MLRVSLVDAPAVESDFVSYAGQERPAMYAVSDEDRRRVFGVVLRADYPIYRRDEDGEYFIVFRADEIRAFAQKCLAEGRQNAVDLNHDFKEIEGAEMVQCFIKDSGKGIAPVGFDEVADGSLFAEYQITDEALWGRIKSGEFHGFSVEIIHAAVPVEYGKQSIFENMKNTLLNRVKMALAKGVEAIEKELSEMESEAEGEKYGAVATDRGTIFWEGDEDLKAGDAVWAEDGDGNRIELEEGDYPTEDGKIIAVADGKCAEIRDKEAEVASEPEKTVETEAEEGAGEEAPADGESAGDESEDKTAELEARIKELEAEVAEKDAKIAELEEKLKQPAGEPAHEAFKKQMERGAEDPFDVYRKYCRR